MGGDQNEEIEIDLMELFFHLLRRWFILLLGMIVGGAAAAGITMLQTPLYESESMLFVLSKTTSITSVADLQFGTALSEDFVIIATSKPVLDTAIETAQTECGVTLTREELLNMVEVTNTDNTRVLLITVISEDPQLSCTLANAVTEATASQMANIMKSDPPTTVERAEVPEEPIDNKLVRNTAIGAMLGFLLLAILFTIPFIMNDRIKTTDDVEKYLETIILGVVPVDKSLGKSSGKTENKKNNKKKDAD